MSQSRPAFHSMLSRHRIDLTRSGPEVLQVNIGKLCNQACLHCHVEAGPNRTELMDARTCDRLIELLEDSPSIHTVDITGGAPELNPLFRSFSSRIVDCGKEVIDRCNLTVFYEKGQEDLPEFLQAHNITVIASLPCYLKDNVEKQRGRGVFDKSIQALRRLNSLGYGQGNPDLQLHLVYNPLGADLPPSQQSLESSYKEYLLKELDISFDRLFTITNMPIKRFLHYLKQTGTYEEYMHLLTANFNPCAAESVMCRSIFSISWEGEIFDCDFNQMLDMTPAAGRKTIFDIESFNELLTSPIAVGDHCFGCTAGNGSSCTGSLT